MAPPPAGGRVATAVRSRPRRDRLLGLIPPEHRGSILGALFVPTHRPDMVGEWAMSGTLGADDPRLQAIIDRIYAARRRREHA